MAVNGVIQRMAALMSTWRRHVSSAARRLTSATARRSFGRRAYLSRRVSNIPFDVAQGKKWMTSSGCSWPGRGFSRNSMKKISEDDDEEEEVWRRTILMGEKCQPLEFSGVIYYDSKGRRAAAPPRSPLRSPLPYVGYQGGEVEQGLNS